MQPTRSSSLGVDIEFATLGASLPGRAMTRHHRVVRKRRFDCFLLTRLLLATFLMHSTGSLHATAEIYRWDTGALIPGTEGIEARTGADLSELDLSFSDLENSDLTGARVRNANFSHANLRGAILAGADLRCSSFVEADLTGVRIDNSASFEANQGPADLFCADLTNANITGAVFSNVLIEKEQFYSTSNYSSRDLREIWFSEPVFAFFRNAYQGIWLDGWSFKDQDLRGANLGGTRLFQADLSGADVRNANFSDVSISDLASLQTDENTVFNQWTVFPEDFEPVDAGLTFRESPAGDFDADGKLNANDVDMLTDLINRRDRFPMWLEQMIDADFDGTIGKDDHYAWVKDLKRTYLGDANLDCEFNSSDIVSSFVAGKYEQSVTAFWSEGDWNADLLFSSSDLVAAFADGGYEKGPRLAAAVPEPTCFAMALAGLFGISLHRRSAR